MTSCLVLGIATLVNVAATTEAESPSVVTVANDYVRFSIAADGRYLHFADRQSGMDHCARGPSATRPRVRIGGKDQNATAASAQGDVVRLSFGTTGVAAKLRLRSAKHYLTVEVVSLEGEGVECFTFLDVSLTLKGSPDEPFAACALALNLKTNVTQIPMASRRLQAMCYPRFGFAGAQAAIVGCPQVELRSVLKEIVTDAPEVPKSSIGGPWALDAEINKGSYLFNFGGMSEQTVDEWIKLARDLGISQIDFHGGNSFRFGDCRPNPETYPNGYASLKAVIDRLHAAGIKAGLHTYAFFINKQCPWVTPVPDPRLAKDATFTLATDLPADAAIVPVAESTQHMCTTIGFFVRNSVTLQIDDELITYRGINKTPPHSFTECTRGACGTKPAAHKAGAKVHHLKECFGLFLPDGDSTLLTEVAAKTAEAYNACGFDMMYLDALDGEDTLGGPENGWHYGSKFVWELFKRAKRHPVMEMSTFHHHLWYVRTRMGAWDHPTRSHKAFIDDHCRANEVLRRQFLPGHLGWWAIKTWTGPQGEPTFADDIEYLCGKCIANDVGLSVMGIGPGQIDAVPVYKRLAGIFKRYETLRHAGAFDESVKAKLREPGKEFTLLRDRDDAWRFRRVHVAKHKVEGVNGWSNVWTVANPFGEQPVRLRIEALMSAGPYDAPGNVTVADFADAKGFADRASAAGVTVGLDSTTTHVKAGACSGALTVTNTGTAPPKGAWAKAGRAFEPPLDLSKHQALGLWVHGDGKGEVLNVQLTSPHHISHGIGDHYVIVDFTGWRYVELIEPEGERHAHYTWPYGGAYAIYRESVSFPHIKTVSLWLNNVPQNQTATCALSPIKALPLVTAKIKNPAITIGGAKIVFPIEMASGSYLELSAIDDCKLYGPAGNLIQAVQPQGSTPVLKHAANTITFSCDGPTDVNPRARVTVIAHGEPI